MAKVSFIVSDTVKTIGLAAGLNKHPTAIDACALHVGDVISFPESKGLFFRVTLRWLEAGSQSDPAEWNILLEPAPDPLSGLSGP
jgi:hypothetical protein